MKLNGQKIEGVNSADIFIPRGDDDYIHLTAQAINDYSEHDILNPMPMPIQGRNRKGELIEHKDSNYDKAIRSFYDRRGAYTIIKSLMLGTPHLEWELININDSNTWIKWREEFETAGFSEIEIGRILLGVNTACGLNEDKVEGARKRFLAGRLAAAADQSFPRGEQNFTVSGELVNESESALPTSS